MPQFAHLHLHSNFSLLDGMVSIKKLCQKVKDCGMTSVAVTDHGNMMGAVNFYNEAKKVGIKPILGIEAYIAPESRLNRSTQSQSGAIIPRYYHIVLLAKNKVGYQNLIKLSSQAYLEGIYYKPRIDKDILFKNAEGLICLSACLAGEIPKLIRASRITEAKEKMLEFKTVFGKDYYFEIMRHGIEDQQIVNDVGVKLARSLGIPIVATNDVHYLNKEDVELHKIILNIQSKGGAETHREYETGEFYFKTADEMLKVFSDIPEAVENANLIADSCNFDYEFGKFHFPKVAVPGGLTEAQYLENLAWEGFEKRYPNEPRDSVIGKRLQYELGVINKMGFPTYFLVVRDFTVHAKDVLDMEVGCARGSVGGSIVAYCLRITEIDPIKYDLMFERFLNPERISMPDIDMDFPESRRHEVIEYVTAKYGEECVSQINTVNLIKARTAIRDVGRVLNVPLDKIDKFAKAMPATITLSDVSVDEPDDPPLLKDMKRIVQELIDNDQEIQNVYRLACGIEGSPRHVGIHAAGVVIADQPLYEYVPLAKEKGNTTTQFDMNILESLGLLKMDFLGLRTLDVIRGAVNLIHQRHGIKIDINNLPMDDAKTCTMLSEGHTKGVFQCDSSGICKLIKEIAPNHMFDCVPIVALYRPGPLESGMVQTYIDCRQGKKEIESLYPTLKALTDPTYGITLYQEQIMSASQIMCGFSIGEADELRKAIGKKNPEKLAKIREKFVKGAKKVNPNDPNIEQTANEIYNKIEYFGRYCFNKAHSAAYGLIMWQTAYLKANYTTDYMCALLTSVMGRDKQFVAYLREARRIGIKILPPNINKSFASFHVTEDNVLLFGLAGIKGVSDSTVSEIVAAREDGDFTSFFNFLERCKINSGVIKALVLAGALDCFGYTRKTLMEKLEGNVLKRVAVVRKEQEIGQISMFDDDDTDAQYGKMTDLPEFDEREILANERDLMGTYLSKHPLDRYQDWLTNVSDSAPISRLIEMQDGQAVVVACTITQVKTITTKKGDAMAFMTVEDKTGEVEAVVFSSVFTNFQNTLMQDRVVLLESYVQMDEVENEQEEVTSKEAKLIVVGVANIEKMMKANKIYVPSSEYMMCKQRRNKKNFKPKEKSAAAIIEVQKQSAIPKKLRIILHPDNIPVLIQAIKDCYSPGAVEIEVCIGKPSSAGIVVSFPLRIDVRAMESIFQIKGLACQAYY